MRRKVHYPGTSVLPMVLTLGIIFLLLNEAHALVALGGLIVLVVAVACVTGAIAWAVMYALRRTGAHRLAEMEVSSHK